MISARMRAGATWSDACILNLSTRGMLLRAARVPERGSYLEIRRGAQVVVARVVWSSPDRFGVQTQDPVAADRLILDPEGTAAQPAGHAPGFVERRAAPRPANVRHEASRWKAHAIQFGTFLLRGAVATLLVGEAVAQALGGPLRAVNAAMASD